MENDKCVFCDPSYYLKDDVCVKIPNCHHSSIPHECSACKWGYSLNDEKECVQNPIENCIRGSSNGLTCNQCWDGYVLIDNICLQSPDMLCSVFE